MKKLNAVIKGIGAFVPEYRLTNEEIGTMVDTTDEWIMSRVGIKERRILKDPNLGSSYLGTKAVEDLLRKTNTKPEDVELLVCATATPDHIFPSNASIIAYNTQLKNAWAFDVVGACSGFLYGLEVASQFIVSGRHKKVILVAAEKMSAITDYTDRTTCPLFGDAGAAILLEGTEEEGIGLIDSDLHTDGVGLPLLQLKAGGSANPASFKTVENREHYIYQEGRQVFKYAVSNMSAVSVNMMKKHNIESNDLAWFVPHQANMRIIEATAHHMNLDKEKVMINIQRYGNTTAATLPLCLWEWENQLKKGDKIIMATFGAGFTWGAAYYVWGY